MFGVYVMVGKLRFLVLLLSVVYVNAVVFEKPNVKFISNENSFFEDDLLHTLGFLEVTFSNPNSLKREIEVNIEWSGSAEEYEDYYELPRSYAIVVDADSMKGQLPVVVKPIKDSKIEAVEIIEMTILEDSLFQIVSGSTHSFQLKDISQVLAPVIIDTLKDINVYNGSYFDLKIDAGGSDNSYQWYKNGTAVNGAHSSTFESNRVSLQDSSFSLHCIVQNEYGADTSGIVTVTVVEKPQIVKVIENPISVSGVIGDTVVFSVGVVGDEPIEYQWYLDSTLLQGEEHETLSSVLNSNLKNSNVYCKVSNTHGTTYSSTARIIVTKPSSSMILLRGELYGNSGVPVGYEDGREMDLRVQLYPSLTTDSLVYEETFIKASDQAVKVVNGKFSVRLGEGTTEHSLETVIRENNNLFVCFVVNKPGFARETLKPRVPLTAAPYAMSSLPPMLKGSADPNIIGLSAPVGTHFINIDSDKTYVKTVKGWVILEN